MQIYEAPLCHMMYPKYCLKTIPIVFISIANYSKTILKIHLNLQELHESGHWFLSCRLLVLFFFFLLLLLLLLLVVVVAAAAAAAVGVVVVVVVRCLHSG